MKRILKVVLSRGYQGRRKAVAVGLALVCLAVVLALAACQNPTSGGSPGTATPYFLYVTNSGSGNGAGGLSAYDVSDGTVSVVPGSPYPTGSGGEPKGVAISPDGKYLFVVNQYSSSATVKPGGISAYFLQGGKPFALANSPYSTGPNASTVGPWGVAISPDGK